MKKLLAAPILFALSACGGSTPPASNGDTMAGCKLNYPSFTMSSPADGTTGVAVATPELIFSGSPDKASYIQPSVTLSTAAGFSYTTKTFMQITGVDTPGSFYSVKLPALSPATTYSVTYTIAAAPSGQTCGGPVNLPEGQFTTQ